MLKLTVLQMFQNVRVGLPLHRDYGFLPSRVERLYVVILQFDLQNLIEVQDGFVRVADLEILVDHPCDLPSREKVCLFVELLVEDDSSFEVSVDDLLGTTRRCRIEHLEVCLQRCPNDCV